MIALPAIARDAVHVHVFVVVAARDDALDEAAERVFPRDGVIARVDEADLALQIVHIPFRIGDEDQIPLGDGDRLVCRVDDALGFTAALGSANDLYHVCPPVRRKANVLLSLFYQVFVHFQGDL